MCNDKQVTDLTDLDDFDQELKGNEKHTQRATPVADPSFIGATASQATKAKYEEPCPKCRGLGYVVFGYTYQRTGTCFRCKGEGKIRHRTSPEQRAAGREARARKAKAKSDAAMAFLKSRPDVAAWFRRQEDRANEFGMSLQEKLFKYGELTERQLAAIERDLARYEERKKERAAQNTGPVVDLRDLPSGYYAVPNGETRLKLRIRHGRKGTRWAGFIFVDDGAHYGQRTNYGRQAPDGVYQGKCRAALLAILADPREACAAYGQLTNTCGVCGRPLEDEESVARGIGPVCAGRF